MSVPKIVPSTFCPSFSWRTWHCTGGIITKICCHWKPVWFVVDSRQPANNKTCCMGNICQHSWIVRVFLCFLFVSSFYMCFNCVLKRVFVVVCLLFVYVRCCCLHGVIKHDDDDGRGYYVHGGIMPVVSRCRRCCGRSWRIMKISIMSLCQGRQ